MFFLFYLKVIPKWDVVIVIVPRDLGENVLEKYHFSER
jgi:hypothetical protein